MSKASVGVNYVEVLIAIALYVKYHVRVKVLELVVVDNGVFFHVAYGGTKKAKMRNGAK